MKKLNIFLLPVLILMCSAVSYSQEIPQFKKLELTDKIINSNTKLELNSIGNNIKRVKIDETKAGEKSAILGALMSAVVPGAGEFYAKSYIKAAAFFLAEAGLWTFYAIQRANGDDKTDEYEAYANQHWDVYKYAAWLKNENFSGAENIDLSADKETLRRQVNAVESVNFSHSLPEYGAQQYYEVIGKYKSFIAGWSDASGVTRANYISYSLPQVDSYMNTRQDANDFYDAGSTALNVVIVNHLLSAADAAWTVSIFNKNLKIETGMHYENRISRITFKEVMVPFGDLKITF
jgi:hypothetical protein